MEFLNSEVLVSMSLLYASHRLVILFDMELKLTYMLKTYLLSRCITITLFHRIAVVKMAGGEATRLESGTEPEPEPIPPERAERTRDHAGGGAAG
jgi:hypothetical protein